LDKIFPHLPTIQMYRGCLLIFEMVVHLTTNVIIQLLKWYLPVFEIKSEDKVVVHDFS
jgi:hypothetical protein